ncbi:MAG: hypothetical protein NTW19_17100 [Planctomycetota bacterium]|nr:hypothetical protein [Planctomycetota bacterium]
MRTYKARLLVLHCKSVAGVTKELWVIALAYNLVRQVKLEAVKRQEADPGRTSVVDALRWLAAANIGEELSHITWIGFREVRHLEQILRLLLELFEVGAGRESAVGNVRARGLSGHDGLLSWNLYEESSVGPGVRVTGRKKVRPKQRLVLPTQVGSALSADRMRPARTD